MNLKNYPEWNNNTNFVLSVLPTNEGLGNKLTVTTGCNGAQLDNRNVATWY